MLKTVLLLDGSEAMNSTAEYQPNYLLALRQPVFQFVRNFLQSSALASLGVAVMRDGVAYTLQPCTTNIHDVLTTLETEYFLYGGSGALSVENGLRVSLSELLPFPQSKQKTTSRGASRQGDVESTTVNGRVLLISASVTVVDPSNVFNVIKRLKKERIEITVVSLLGAVHVLHQCAVRTGGLLHCPLNYRELRQQLTRLAVAHLSSASKGKGKNAFSTTMIPIGFPLWGYLKNETKSEAGVKAETRETAEGPEEKHDLNLTTQVLRCPECNYTQTSIPTTCRHCGLRLCSAPMLYNMFISRNHFISPVKSLGIASPSTRSHDTSVLVVSRGTVDSGNSSIEKPGAKHQRSEENQEKSLSFLEEKCNVDLTVPGDVRSLPDQADTSSSMLEYFTCTLCAFNTVSTVMCPRCGANRCAECQKYCEEVLCLCPTCIALH